MKKARAARIIAIVLAPFVVLAVTFAVVYTHNGGGAGPDDGAIMNAMIISFPLALLVAAPLWSISVLFLFRKSAQAKDSARNKP